MERERSRSKSKDSSPEPIGRNEHHATLTHIEKGGNASDDFVEDPELTKKLLRKVDYRLLPVLTLLYLMSYMDRSMIGNARILGLQDDLQLSDPQFNMTLTIFFIPYALLEVPANVLLKLFKPRWWLTIITLAWGAVMTLSGLVNNYAGLLAVRFFLGVTEVRKQCHRSNVQ